MYLPKYHEDSEQIDDELFNEFTTDTHYFKWVKRNNVPYSAIDYIGEDIKGRKVNIELKRRNTEHDKYLSTYIETDKMYRLINKYLQFGQIPLYINFYSNDTILMFDLRYYENPHKDLKHKKVKITNHGYDDEEQMVWRVELPNRDAIHFKKINDKWVFTNGRTIIQN